MPGPFDLRDERAYEAWRVAKLAARPRGLEELLVEIADPDAPGEDALEAVRRACARANAALVRFPAPVSKETLRAFAARLGLRRLDHNPYADEDAVTSLRVRGPVGPGAYIPYTDRPLSWHTDGYYNVGTACVRGFVLHCVRPAAEGGESLLLDHELAYIDLRDEDPRLVAALMAPDAMTIPPNEDPRARRGARTGPVISVDGTGRLHLRYTARARNVVWKDDPWVRAAAERLRTLPERRPEWVLRRRLEAGETLVTNNVLHARTGFRDAPGRERLLYRARYHDAVVTPRATREESERAVAQ